jgi:hypothetical protein
MGRKAEVQNKLFYEAINLDRRVRKDHILRKIAELIDFDFIYKEVRETYGNNGNVSVPPPVILKMMLLLVLYNVRSEREMIDTIPERLDWLWFLDYDLDDDIPNHSVLSKAVIVGASTLPSVSSGNASRPAWLMAASFYGFKYGKGRCLKQLVVTQQASAVSEQKLQNS